MEHTPRKPLIAILGTGAMARYWAWVLKEATPLIVGQVPPPYYIDHGPREVLNLPFAAWQDPILTPPDVVLLLTKWRNITWARNWIQRFAPNSLVITLMNGMGHERALSPLPEKQIVAGITTAAATRDDHGQRTVRISSRGDTFLPNLPDPRLAFLQHAAFPLIQWVTPEELLTLRWQKLLFNSVINPLTALANCPNGDLPRHPLWSLAPRLLDEGRAVASAAGGRLPRDLATKLRDLVEATRLNISSMLQDVRQGLPTEVAAINGFLVAEGARRGIPTPLNQALVSLVEALTP